LASKNAWLKPLGVVDRSILRRDPSIVVLSREPDQPDEENTGSTT
jgi:hypothetical protein